LSDAVIAPSDRNRWLALYVLCVGMLMIVLDSTIVNVALPSIQEDLGFSQNDLAWVVNAYLIAFGGLLLLAGRIGDLIGQRRIFLLGLAVFTGASLLCALAQSQGVLIGARFIQGVGGALSSAVILGLIVTMFPDPRAQARAIGVYGFVASAGASIGLLLGGVLTDALNWHWIFLVNIPFGIATILLAIRLVDDQPGIGLGRGADVAGAVLITSALMLGVYTIVEVTDRGWLSGHTVGFGAGALVLLAAFTVRQLRAANPLVRLRIFRSRNVSGANAIQLLMVASLFGMFFLGALYLQGILGYDAFEVGVAFLPLSIGIGVLSLGFSARLNLRFGPRATLVPGLALIAAGLALFATVPLDSSYWTDIFPVVALLGIGAGLAVPSLMTLAMSGAPEGESGLASGIVNTGQQLGGALGISALATVATSRANGLLAKGEPAASALMSGYRLAFAIGAAMAVAAIVLAVRVLRAEPKTGSPDRSDVDATAADSDPAYSGAT
jgi:EmrB/QacA subfamily drug resistance transporter